jgi:hypothetical protein
VVRVPYALQAFIKTGVTGSVRGASHPRFKLNGFKVSMVAVEP